MKTKNFKMTELGPIPKDWEVKRLGDVAPLQRGFDLPTAELEDGPYPVVYSNGIGNYHRKAMCDAPGLVTGRSGTIGHFTYIAEGRYWPHNTALWVTSFNGNHPLFVKYLYETLGFENFSTGTGVPTLNRNIVHDYLISLPPLPEQRKIAAALSNVDEMIAALEKLIEKKRKIKTGAMQELLGTAPLCPSADSAFSARGENAHAENAENAEKLKVTVGFLPRRRLPGFKGAWVEKRLGDVVEVLDNRRVPLNDSQRQSGPYPYCGANGIVDFIDRYIFDEEVILMAEDGGNFQDFANRPIAYKMRGKFWVNNHAHVLKAVIGIDQDFLFCQLVHKDITDTITGGTREKLTRGQLENLMVVFPPTLAEQKAIAKVLGDMDEEIAALEAELAKTRQLKQGMMQELLTGKVRLV